MTGMGTVMNVAGILAGGLGGLACVSCFLASAGAWKICWR